MITVTTFWSLVLIVTLSKPHSEWRVLLVVKSALFICN